MKVEYSVTVTLDNGIGFTLEDKHIALVCDLASYCSGGAYKIPVIKFFRAEYNLGLKEAKDLVDAIANLDVHSTKPINLGELLRSKLAEAQS